jgi:hydroxymethylbilane synthase
LTALRIGTRGSALALAQARWVAEHLPVDAELVTVTTSGDQGSRIGDKSRWVDAIEAALVAGEIDLAVHSAKDVPGELAPGCAIVAAPERADAADVLIGELRAGARVGTSALRRRAQLLAARPDLEVVDLRGNVDTRLRKLRDGEADAIVLAAAGLARLGLDVASARLDHVPAPGQGILAIEAREDDTAVTAAAAAINDAATFAALGAERAAVRVLGATCHTPVGVHAEPLGDGRFRLRGFAGLPDGSAWVLDELDAARGEELAERMLAAGAGEILEQAERLGEGPADGATAA